MQDESESSERYWVPHELSFPQLPEPGLGVNELRRRLDVLRPQIQALRTELNALGQRLGTQMILREARAFYEGGEESGNKMYINADTEKTVRRNKDADRVNDSLPQLRNDMYGVPLADEVHT